jgi:uncharacterized protein YecE (DUF72 family)
MEPMRATPHLIRYAVTRESPTVIFIGTAGWSLPRAVAAQFPKEGTHLERYAQVFNSVEINSSFYRSHAREVYRRWADATPRGFRFSVKVPQSITHDARLRRARTPLQLFLDDTNGLGRKLGPLLLQLPPSLEFDSRVVRRFFATLREIHNGTVVCEPRHDSWFSRRADRVLEHYRISRAAADPAIVASSTVPGGSTRRLVYYRLHGSPRRYWSSYSQDRLHHWAEETRARGRGTDSWFIFDNTASGAATVNALQLRALLFEQSR